MATGKAGEAEQPVEKGTVLDFPKAETVPGFLVGKCRVVGADDGGRTLVAGSTAELEALREEYKELTGKPAHMDMKADNLRAKINEAKAKK